MEFLLFNKPFFFPQAAQFEKGINLFCLVFLTLELLFAVFYNWHNSFRLFYNVYYTVFSGFWMSSFISLYSLNTLFIETNSSWLAYKLVRASKMKNLTVLNLIFAVNTILSCFFLFFLINKLCLFSYCSDFTHFHPYCRTCNTTEAPNNEAKAEIET